MNNSSFDAFKIYRGRQENLSNGKEPSNFVSFRKGCQKDTGFILLNTQHKAKNDIKTFLYNARTRVTGSLSIHATYGSTFPPMNNGFILYLLNRIPPT